MACPFFVGDEVEYQGDREELKGLRGPVERVDASGRVVVRFNGNAVPSFVHFTALRAVHVRQFGSANWKGNWKQKFHAFMGTGSELHRQIYHGVREFPQAFTHLGVLSFTAGTLVGWGFTYLF